RALRDGCETGQEDVEALAVLALPHDGRARRELVAAHAVREPRERLPGELREEPDPGQLRHARRYVTRRHGDTVVAMGLLTGWKTCPRCASPLSGDKARMTCGTCDSVYYAHSTPAVAAALARDGKI